jgi:hypothetical protein
MCFVLLLVFCVKYTILIRPVRAAAFLKKAGTASCGFQHAASVKAVLPR